jgi:hypothetical protein
LNSVVDHFMTEMNRCSHTWNHCSGVQVNTRHCLWAGKALWRRYYSDCDTARGASGYTIFSDTCGGNCTTWRVQWCIQQPLLQRSQEVYAPEPKSAPLFPH